MNFVVLTIAIVFGLMLAEQRVSARNEKQLLASGAVLPPGDVYRTMAVLYPAAFLLMGLEGVWRASIAPPPANGGPSWMASGVVLFAASKGLKYWAIRTLGDRWSFRVIVQAGRPLVTTGPYRYLTHPNYVGVVGELLSTAMMVGAPVTGPLMLLAFGIVLRARIRFEERALASLRA